MHNCALEQEKRQNQRGLVVFQDVIGCFSDCSKLQRWCLLPGWGRLGGSAGPGRSSGHLFRGSRTVLPPRRRVMCWGHCPGRKAFLQPCGFPWRALWGPPCLSLAFLTQSSLQKQVAKVLLMEWIAKNSGGGVSVNEREGMENHRLQKYSWSTICLSRVSVIPRRASLCACGHLIPVPPSLCPCALQAMGVYLYGELMLSEDPRQQQVARRCFELTKEQMERSSAEVVAEMLF